MLLFTYLSQCSSNDFHLFRHFSCHSFQYNLCQAAWVQLSFLPLSFFSLKSRDLKYCDIYLWNNVISISEQKHCSCRWYKKWIVFTHIKARISSIVSIPILYRNCVLWNWWYEMAFLEKGENKTYFLIKFYSTILQEIQTLLKKNVHCTLVEYKLQNFFWSCSVFVHPDR